MFIAIEPHQAPAGQPSQQTARYARTRRWDKPQSGGDEQGVTRDFEKESFFPLLPSPPRLQKTKYHQVLKLPRTRRENFTTLISKIEGNHRLSTVGFVLQKKQVALQRENRDVFIRRRGLGSSYCLQGGSYKRLSHPLKEELQLFCPPLLPKNKHFGGDAGGGEGAGRTSRGATRLPIYEPRKAAKKGLTEAAQSLAHLKRNKKYIYLLFKWRAGTRRTTSRRSCGISHPKGSAWR